MSSRDSKVDFLGYPQGYNPPLPFECPYTKIGIRPPSDEALQLLSPNSPKNSCRMIYKGEELVYCEACPLNPRLK